MEGTVETLPTNFGAATAQAFSSLSRGEFEPLVDYASKHLLPALIAAAIGLGVIFLGYLVARYLSGAVSRPIRRRVDETLGRFVAKVVFYCVLLAVTGAVLSTLGAPLGGLAAMLAAAGFAIGLAFQGTLSNFAAGVLMLVFRPFKVGDVINAAGVIGTVNEIDLFTTSLDTPDNRRIIVPNSSISSGTIENISFHPHRRIEVLVGVAYDADLQTTRHALQTAVISLQDHVIPGDDRGSAIVLADLGDSAVQWKVRMWVASENYWSLREQLVGEVKRQLDLAGVSIPFPQLDVHLHRADDGQLELPARPRMRPVRRSPETPSSVGSGSQ